jgi:hypothetical protein
MKGWRYANDSEIERCSDGDRNDALRRSSRIGDDGRLLVRAAEEN